MMNEVGHDRGWLILNIDHCTNTISGETEERMPVGIVTQDRGHRPAEEADHGIHPHEQLTRARYLTGAQRSELLWEEPSLKHAPVAAYRELLLA